jgi:hypothetical protein
MDKGVVPSAFPLARRNAGGVRGRRANPCHAASRAVAGGCTMWWTGDGTRWCGNVVWVGRRGGRAMERGGVATWFGSGDVADGRWNAVVWQRGRGEASANTGHVITRIFDRACFAPTPSHAGNTVQHAEPRRIVARHRTRETRCNTPNHVVSSPAIARGEHVAIVVRRGSMTCMAGGSCSALTSSIALRRAVLPLVGFITLPVC